MGVVKKWQCFFFAERYKIRLFKQIHPDDAECGLCGGQQLLLGVVNVSACITHAPGPMGRPCMAGEVIAGCGCRILDAHMNRRTIVTGIQLRHHRPGHGGIHQGKQNTPMGLIGKGPAHRRFRPQNGMGMTRFHVFNVNAKGVIKRIMVYPINKRRVEFHCFILSLVPPGADPQEIFI